MLCSSLKSAFKVNQKTRVFQKGEKESFLDFEWSRLSYNVLVYWLHVCLPGGNLVCAVSSVSRGTMQRTCGKRGQVQGQLWDSPCDLIKEITLGLSQKKKKKSNFITLTPKSSHATHYVFRNQIYLQLFPKTIASTQDNLQIITLCLWSISTVSVKLIRETNRNTYLYSYLYIRCFSIYTCNFHKL